MRLFKRKKASGGLIPGHRNDDAIAVRLSPGSAFVSDGLRGRIGDDGVRRILGLSGDAEVYSPRDWPRVP